MAARDQRWKCSESDRVSRYRNVVSFCVGYCKKLFVTNSDNWLNQFRWNANGFGFKPQLCFTMLHFHDDALELKWINGLPSSNNNKNYNVQFNENVQYTCMYEWQLQSWTCRPLVQDLQSGSTFNDSIDYSQTHCKLNYQVDLQHHKINAYKHFFFCIICVIIRPLFDNYDWCYHAILY